MGQKPLLLIVDDEKGVATTLQMVFELEGFAVRLAHSCADALRLFDKTKLIPDVLITDLNMEKEDIGLEVARAARELKPRPAIIVSTGYASEYNTREAHKIGVDYFALKPVEIQELIAVVRRLVLRRAAAK